MSRVSGQRDRGASSEKLGLALDLHVLSADEELCNSTVTGTDKHVTIGEELQAVDTLREESVAWADTLEKSTIEVDLNDVSCEGSEVGRLVIRGDGNALIDSLELSHGHVLEQNLLLSVVDVPDADTIVVDGDQVIACVVVEGDFVGNVHADSMTANSVSCFSLI